MEDPCLGMQARGTDVVGDPDIRSGFGQEIERFAFRRVRVRGGEDPQAPSIGTVAPKRVQEWPDTAASDEGHHHVDGARGGDLRSQLTPQSRFTRRVGQQGRVE